MNGSLSYTKSQLYSLVALRVLIGWHFLYEGLAKLLNPSWSAYGYLMDSGGFMKEVFVSMASNPSVLLVVDFLNVWGLILVGAGLLLGFLTRFASIGGILLLLFYLLSHPSLIGVRYAIPSEGSYLWVNKNIIEMAAIVVLYVFPTSKIIGLDSLFFKNKKN